MSGILPHQTPASERRRKIRDNGRVSEPNCEPEVAVARDRHRTVTSGKLLKPSPYGSIGCT